jgi:hypothetical protein
VKDLCDCLELRGIRARLRQNAARRYPKIIAQMNPGWIARDDREKLMQGTVDAISEYSFMY